MGVVEVGTTSEVEFTTAYQPIVDTSANGTVFAYEALIRGPNGEGADWVFGNVPVADALAFDERCRSHALSTAFAFGIRERLSLNISARAICHRRHGLYATLRTASQLGLRADDLIFEMTEHDPIPDIEKLGRWISAARGRKVKFAMDDFGAGYAGLNMLLSLRPEIIKLDMALVRNVNTDRTRQALIKGIIDACSTFGCLIVAEGVETQDEFSTLSMLGITLMQGYLFARPELARSLIATSGLVFKAEREAVASP